MVASHEVALINSVFQKGIRGYDVEKAYEAIRQVQTTPGRAHPGGGLVGNRQLEPYLRLGYVPHDVGGLVAWLGAEEFNSRLEKGFVESSKSNFNATGDLFAHYPINHGNQPNMQAAGCLIMAGVAGGLLYRTWYRNLPPA